MKKTQIIKTLCLAIAFVFAANISQAQFRQSVYLDGAMPVGSWATTTLKTIPGISTFTDNVPLSPANMGKTASIGFGGGYRAQYLFDVGVGEVAPFANVDVIWNTVNKTVNNAYTQHNMTSTQYINVPVFVGVMYQYDRLFSNITIYGEAGIGADFFFMTPEGDRSNSNLWYAYKPTGTVAGEIGAGAYFGRYFSAGIHYYILGEHTVDMTAKTAENHSAEQTYYTTAGNRETRNLGALMLRIGFHL
ncbi:MAG: hypothetical protein K5650_07765 [Bacteroidales bacterium]|nr:hypothetical protein [Bacteroidales bacterium]